MTVTRVYCAQMCVSDPWSWGATWVGLEPRGAQGEAGPGDRWLTRAVPRRDSRPAWLPQVDELYEGYCIQWRLRDGASNMQRAFSNSTQSRASRESLQELGRSLQGCLEVGHFSLPLLWAAGWGRGRSWPVIDPTVDLAGHVPHRGGLGRSPGRVSHQDER